MAGIYYVIKISQGGEAVLNIPKVPNIPLFSGWFLNTARSLRWQINMKISK